MKNKELKNLWKLAKRVWIIGTLIWILETAIFLLYEGWHLKATHPIEKWFDKLVGDMWGFALCLTLIICGKYLINLTFKRKK